MCDYNNRVLFIDVVGDASGLTSKAYDFTRFIKDFGYTSNMYSLCNISVMNFLLHESGNLGAGVYGLYLRSDIINSQNTYNTETGGTSDIIAYIPNYKHNNIYGQTYEPKAYLESVPVSNFLNRNIRFYITDQDGNLITDISQKMYFRLRIELIK